MINQEEYLLLMKLNDIDKYNEIKKEKNNNKNKYGEYCEKCNGYLNLSNNKKYLICSICSSPYYDILPEENKKKIYHVNERKKIMDNIFCFICDHKFTDQEIINWFI